MFPSDGIVISISLQVEFTESLTMMSGLFAVSNAFQNIHKHVMIFLTQQPFVLRFVFSNKSGDFAYLCDFVTNFGYAVTEVLLV